MPHGPHILPAMTARRAPWCGPDEGHVHRVLVVEDEPAVRGLEADILGQEGYAALRSPNGALALERARAERPCLALVDIRMPVIDGPAFVRLCRADRELRSLPIIFVSGYPQELGEGLSVEGFIPKPFEPRELLDGVATALDGPSP